MCVAADVLFHQQAIAGHPPRVRPNRLPPIHRQPRKSLPQKINIGIRLENQRVYLHPRCGLGGPLAWGLDTYLDEQNDLLDDTTHFPIRTRWGGCCITEPVLSPDGTRLAYTTREGIVTTGPDG